jgi:hypothetical protein
MLYNSPVLISCFSGEKAPSIKEKQMKNVPKRPKYKVNNQQNALGNVYDVFYSKFSHQYLPGDHITRKIWVRKL